MWLALWALWIPLPAPVAAQAADPHLRWYTLETEHFEVHYHAPLEPLARAVAAMAERSHRWVTEDLGFDPGHPTHIVLTDLTDGANGIASVIPRNMIRLFAAAPSDMSTIGDYDDWLSLLLTHEHTHIHHLAEDGGLPAFVNAIFGRTYLPNQHEPGWVIEGIATWQESRHSSGGRLRSTLVDAYLRTDALEDRIPTLEALSHDVIRWPHGDIRYLYGAHFIDHIARHHGAEAIAQIARQYGRQPLPYGLNRMALRATGLSFDALYADFTAELRARSEAQAARVRARGLRVGASLLTAQDVLRTPRFVPGGPLVYFARNGERTPQVRALPVHAARTGRDERTSRHIGRVRGTSYLSAHPDGQHVLLSMPAPHRDIYVFQDLFSMQLETGELTRLTRGLRAREPDVSPDGKRVVFVTQSAGTSQLEIASLEDVAGTRVRLFRGQALEQVFTPRFSPDGRLVTFSAWRTGGYRDILVLNLSTGAVTELTRDRAQDTSPVFSRDGALVIFASDRDGISNLYAFERKSGVVHRITDVLGGAYHPEPTPDGKGVVYIGYESRGFGLRRAPLSLYPSSAYTDLRPAPVAAPKALNARPAPYSPWPTILPANYELTVQSGAAGTEAQIVTTGQDVARYHAYALFLRSAVDASEASASLDYAYQRLPIRPRLGLFHALEARRDLRVAGERRRWLARNTGASLGLSYTFPGVFGRVSMSANYTLNHVARARPLGGALRPLDPPPQLPSLGFIPSVNLGLRYSDLRRQAYDISTSEGQRATLGIRVTDPLLGRDIRAVRVAWSLSQYLQVPWARRHVAAFYYAGGHAAGDASRLSTFTIGGFPSISPLADPQSIILDGSFPLLSGIRLRGFPAGYRTGTQFHLLLTEYRFPLLDLDWGLSTLPFYIRRVFGSVFANLGDAYDGAFEAERLAVGAGGELFFELKTSYNLGLNLRLGAARGITRDGQTQFYMNLGSFF